MISTLRMVCLTGVVVYVNFLCLVGAISKITVCCNNDPASLSNGSQICLPCAREVFPEIHPCARGHFMSGRKCKPCRKCGPGSGVKRRCKRDRDTVCKPCRKGTFSSKKSSILPCRPCKRCDQHEEKTKDCRPSKDTKCKCEKGYFRSNYLGQCWKCSYCFPEYPNLTANVPECRLEENRAEYRCQPLDRPPFVQQKEEYADGVNKLPESFTVTKGVQQQLAIGISVAFLLFLIVVIILVKVARQRQRKDNEEYDETGTDKNAMMQNRSTPTEIRWIEKLNTCVVKTSQISQNMLMDSCKENYPENSIRHEFNNKTIKDILHLESRMNTRTFWDLIISGKENIEVDPETLLGKVKDKRNITNVKKPLLIVNKCEYSASKFNFKSAEDDKKAKSLTTVLIAKDYHDGLGFYNFNTNASEDKTCNYTNSSEPFWPGYQTV